MSITGKSDQISSDIGLTSGKLIMSTDIDKIESTGITVDSSDNITTGGNITMTSSKTLKTNNITSIGTNDDITIDANGTGKIYLNTLQNGGVTMINSPSNPTWLSNSSYQQNSNRALVWGTYFQNSEYLPCVGGHTVDLLAWAPLWLNFGTPTEPVIVGNTTSTAAKTNSNMLYVVGNMESTGTCRASRYFASGNLFCDTSRNVTCNNLTINGSYPRNINSHVSLTTTYPTTLSFNIVLPANVDILKTSRFLVQTIGINGTIDLEIRDASNNLLSWSTINNNATQVRTIGSNFVVTGNDYLTIRMVWTSGSTGSIVFQSYNLIVE